MEKAFDEYILKLFDEEISTFLPEPIVTLSCTVVILTAPVETKLISVPLSPS